MAANDLQPELLRQVRSAEVRRYALAAGWKRNEAVNGKVAVFQHPSSDLDQLIVPVEGSEPDGFALLMGEAIRKLAEQEKRPAAEVLNDLLLPPADVLRFRNAGPESETGSLPLEQAVQMVTGVRRLLAAAAHSVLEPRPYYTRLRRADAEEFVNRCRVGQTERGSFTLTLACPLDLPPAGTVLFDPPPEHEPFPRRVTRLVMASLEQLAQAVDRGQVDSLEDRTKHQGLSANFCEALLMLRPTGERSVLGVSAAWSRLLRLPAGRTIGRVEVELRPEAFEAAEYLAPRLRSAPEPRVGRYVGYVDVLRGAPIDVDGPPAGEVHIAVYDGEDLIRARANLSVADYAVAGQAHLSSSLVSFRGTLRRLPRLNQIDEIEDFELLDAEEHPAPTGPPPDTS